MLVEHTTISCGLSGPAEPEAPHNGGESKREQNQFSEPQQRPDETLPPRSDDLSSSSAEMSSDVGGNSGATTTTPQGQQPRAARTPWWAYGLVAIAVASMSWGAVLFALLVEVPAPLKACWRLQLMALMQLPGALVDYGRMDAALRSRWIASLPLLSLNGVVLGIHFVAFAWGLDHTVFAVANVLVSTPPIMFVSAAAAVYVYARLMAEHPLPFSCGGSRSSRLSSATTAVSAASSRALLASQRWINLHRGAQTPAPQPSHDEPAAGAVTQGASAAAGLEPVTHSAAARSSAPLSSSTSCAARVRAGMTWRGPLPLPPTRLEACGALCAFTGVVVLVIMRGVLPSFDGGSAPTALIREHSLAGDIAELLAALTIAIYLAIGRRVRAWCPLWAYSLPVTGIAAVTTAALALADGAEPWGINPGSLLGWASRPDLLGLAAASAFVPGILGHGLVNLSLLYVHPLVVSTMQLLQPLLSGGYGWAVGVQGVPSPATLLACPIILAGIACTVLGSRSSPLHGGCAGLVASVCDAGSRTRPSAAAPKGSRAMLAPVRAVRLDDSGEG